MADENDSSAPLVAIGFGIAIIGTAFLLGFVLQLEGWIVGAGISMGLCVFGVGVYIVAWTNTKPYPALIRIPVALFISFIIVIALVAFIHAVGLTDVVETGVTNPLK